MLETLHVGVLSVAIGGEATPEPAECPVIGPCILPVGVEVTFFWKAGGQAKRP